MQRPVDAELDIVDVDLDEQEPFALVDDDAEIEEKVTAKTGDSDESADDEPTGADEDHEERISRRDRRINQLIARAKEAEERAAAVEAALELERQQRELERKSGAVNEETAALDEQIAAINQQIQDEADDPAMQALLKSQRFMLERERSRASKQQEPRQEQAPEPPPSYAAQQVHPAASEWLSENAWYNAQDEYGRHQYPTLRDEATKEYGMLKSRYGGDSKELFEELNRRLSELPEFERVLNGKKRVNGNGHDQVPERPSRQNTAPANTRAGDRDPERVNGSREPKLDSHDKAKLRALGQDPDDPKVRAAYIKYNPRKFGRASA